MRALSRVIFTAIVMTLANVYVSAPAFAQRVYRDSDASMRSLINRIENRTDTFSRTLENALDRSTVNNTAREDEVNRLVTDLEAATDRLKSRFEARQSTAADAREVLNRAGLINSFMVNNRLSGRVEQDWRLLQTDLDSLARAYYISDWRWNVIGTSPGYVDTRQLAGRIATRTTRFSRSFRQSLIRGRTDNWEANEARRRLVQFENAATRLRNVTNNRNTGANEARTLLEHASYLNNFVINNRLTGRAESDWTLLRSDLDQLASAYNIAWNWTGTPDPGGPIYSDGTLTGTYRLNVSRSGNPRTAADAATRNLPVAQRQRAHDALLRRLDPPDVLAIEQRGTNVTIASSRAPQINFVADGREHVETNPNGRTVRVRASLNGDQLVIDRTGDRAQDFSVTFAPIESGRRLLVTRRLFSDRMTQPVIVQSYYDKTSEVAQLDVYRGSPDYGNVAATGDFVIPNNTQLVAVLDTDLSTETARENDRFTMTVRSPNQYQGARIEGYVSNVERSGRITGRSSFTMNFDRIRMPDGRSYAFAGMVESVRTPDNETVRIDNEGEVRESDQTGRTITRTAIGTAVGAIIGAIAGGGQGAAVGAVIGAGAGAGSVYVQGRDDLDLDPGTEVVIRATGPR